MNERIHFYGAEKYLLQDLHNVADLYHAQYVYLWLASITDWHF